VQIKHWLELIEKTHVLSPAFAKEVVQLANLIKGYGDTYKRGLAHYNAIIDSIVTPFLKGEMLQEYALDAILNARKAAQKDPEGETLAQTLSQITRMKDKK
jgi:indolepyruvate ferredoxin oxidoreductase, beta subunit